MGMTSLMLVGLFALGAWVSPVDTPLTWIFCVTGYVLGVPVGMLASPYKGVEPGNFRVFGGLAATFLSGYVLSKIDGEFVLEHVTETVDVARTLLFTSTFVLGAVQIFIFRSYSNTEREGGQYGPPGDRAVPTSQEQADSPVER